MTNHDEIDYDDIDDDEAEEDCLQPYDRSKRNLAETIVFSTIAMIAGIVAGIAGDGTAEVLNDFHARTSNSHRAIQHTEIAASDPQPLPAENPQWYPENNHIEWSISLRPNEIPIGIDVRNESLTRNLRISFLAPDGRTYRHAATLYVQAAKQSVIRLPAGQYRIDIAGSPVQMPWQQAQRQVSIPSYSLQLSPENRESMNLTRLDIDEDGKVRQTKKRSPASPVESKKPKSDSLDYRELSRRSIDESSAEEADVEIDEQ